MMRFLTVVLSLLLDGVFIYGLVKVVKRLSGPAKSIATRVKAGVTK